MSWHSKHAIITTAVFTSFPTKRKETQDFAEATFLRSERHPYRIYKKKEKIDSGQCRHARKKCYYKPNHCNALSLIDQIAKALCEYKLFPFPISVSHI